MARRYAEFPYVEQTHSRILLLLSQKLARVTVVHPPCNNYLAEDETSSSQKNQFTIMAGIALTLYLDQRRFIEKYVIQHVSTVVVCFASS